MVWKITGYCDILDEILNPPEKLLAVIKRILVSHARDKQKSGGKSPQ